MSHIVCRHCGSNEHTSGYGLAAGGMSSYTFCECGKLLERHEDLGGVTEEQLIEKVHRLNAMLLDVHFNGRNMVEGDIYERTATLDELG